MEYTTGQRTQVVAAYQADPTLTVRQLQAQFKVGKTTIAKWLSEVEGSRSPGARKGSRARSRLTPTERHPDFDAPAVDDFGRFLRAYFGGGRWRRDLVVKAKARAYWTNDENWATTGREWLEAHTVSATVQTDEAYALTCRAVGKSWRAIALDLLTERSPDPTDPDLPRRAALAAVDLKRRVKRRLAALAKHPDYADAVREFSTNWLDRKPEWMRSAQRKAHK
jgi:hypothetical protein